MILRLLTHKWTYPKFVPQKRYETKNRNESKMKDSLRKRSRLLRNTTGKEDQAMEQNNALEAKTTKEETRTTLTMDLRDTPPLLIRISLQNQTSHMGKTIRIR